MAVIYLRFLPLYVVKPETWGRVCVLTTDAKVELRGETHSHMCVVLQQTARKHTTRVGSVFTRSIGQNRNVKVLK